MIPLSERHLRHAISEYTRHYHLERNHQGIGNLLIEKRSSARPTKGKVMRGERLGGMLNFYYREAA